MYAWNVIFYINKTSCPHFLSLSKHYSHIFQTILHFIFPCFVILNDGLRESFVLFIMEDPYMTLDLLFIEESMLYGSLSFDFDGVNLYYYTVWMGSFLQKR